MTEPTADLVTRLHSDAERHRPHMPDTVRLLREAADALEAQEGEIESWSDMWAIARDEALAFREAGNRLRKELDAHTKVCGCIGCDGAIAAWDALTASGASNNERTGEHEMKTVWIPEAPEHPGLYAMDPAGSRADGCIMGGVSSYDPRSAMQFDTEAECAAWCAAHPDPAFVPREHGFVERIEP